MTRELIREFRGCAVCDPIRINLNELVGLKLAIFSYEWRYFRRIDAQVLRTTEDGEIFGRMMSGNLSLGISLLPASPVQCCVPACQVITPSSWAAAAAVRSTNEIFRSVPRVVIWHGVIVDTMEMQKRSFIDHVGRLPCPFICKRQKRLSTYLPSQRGKRERSNWFHQWEVNWWGYSKISRSLNESGERDFG